MKKHISGYLLLALLCTVPSHAKAATFMGQFCWQAHLTQNEMGPLDLTEIVKLDVTNMGGPSLTAQGSMTITGDAPLIISGGGQIIGNEVVLTLNTTQQHLDPYRDSGITQSRINTTTLNGTMWSNYMFFNATTGEKGQGWGLGTLTHIPCP